MKAILAGMSLLLAFLLSVAPLQADEYSLEKFDQAPPTDKLAKPVAATLEESGIAVKRSEESTLCNIWLCKTWDVKDGFKPTLQVLYPFKLGQLIGVVEYKRRAADFRDQTIDKGVYTIRYTQQPVDGNHVGTSPTQDFFVLLKAEDDKTADILPYEKLVELSAAAAESNHPAILPLKMKQSKAEAPSIRHVEDDDWWIVQLQSAAKDGKKTSPLAFELVLVGTTSEF